MRRRFRIAAALLISLRQHDEAVHGLDRPARLLKVRGKIVEKLRVRGTLAPSAEVVLGGDEAGRRSGAARMRLDPDAPASGVVGRWGESSASRRRPLPTASPGSGSPPRISRKPPRHLPTPRSPRLTAEVIMRACRGSPSTTA